MATPPHLRVRGEAPGGDRSQQPNLLQQVLDLLAQAGQPLTRTALRARLTVNNQRLGEVLEQLERDRRLARTDQEWSIDALS